MTDPTHTITDRGLIDMPFIDLGGERRIKVYESSAADTASIWLSVVDDYDAAYAHLTLDQAREIARRLTWLADNHRMAQEIP